MGETESKLKGTLLTGKPDGEQRSTLRGDLAKKSKLQAPKAENISDFKNRLHVGRKFSSDNYDYEITRITDAMVATQSFDKKWKSYGTRNLNLDQLWGYYQEGKITLL